MADKEQKISEKELRKITRKANRSEEQVILYKFIIILLLVILCVGGIYFFTKKFVAKDSDNTNTKQEVTFDYSKIILGELLNRPYNEYYVMVYNIKDNPKANYYSNMEYSYSNKENSLKIYTADLSDSMNAKFYNSESTNKNASKVEELAVGDITLIKVKNGSIVKYIEEDEAIKIELGL